MKYDKNPGLLINGNIAVARRPLLGRLEKFYMFEVTPQLEEKCSHTNKIIFQVHHSITCPRIH